jgi:signal transduction histidine kinase
VGSIANVRRLAPGKLPLVVLLLGIALSVGGFFLARAWVAESEDDELRAQATQTAAVMASFGRQVEALLTAGSAIAEVTNGDPEAFTDRILARIEGTAVSSISLLRRTPSGWESAADAGASTPVLLPSFDADEHRRLDEIAARSGQILLVRVGRVGEQPVSGFATSAGDGFVVYGESVTPVLSQLFFFRLPHGLHFALYIRAVRPEYVISSSTTALPIAGKTVEVPLRFGAENAVLVVGGTSDLVGGLAGAAPWLVLGLGISGSVVLAFVIQLTRRRAAADASRVALAAQNDQLRELDRMKDELVATVSHELRTPLTSILGYLELMREDTDDLTPAHRSFVEVIERNARRLLGLVGDLLFIARLDAGGIRLAVEQVDLEQIARDCVLALRPRAEAAGLSLELETEEVGRMQGDRARLADLLDNLVSNAIKFTPRGGWVSVRLSRADGEAKLEVEDTGIGVPGDEQVRLFDRFFRSSTASAAAIPGTGLGLAISKAIVEAHGGTIGVASVEGAGTTFRVMLPLAPVSAPADESADALVR